MPEPARARRLALGKRHLAAAVAVARAAANPVPSRVTVRLRDREQQGNPGGGVGDLTCHMGQGRSARRPRWPWPGGRRWRRRGLGPERGATRWSSSGIRAGVRVAAAQEPGQLGGLALVGLDPVAGAGRDHRSPWRRERLPHIEDLQRQLLLVAEPGGEEARALAERLVAPLAAALRLALQDVLSAAAEEITCDLAPGSLELRLRGQDPEFVVTLPPPEEQGKERQESGAPGGSAGWPVDSIAGDLLGGETEEGELARINLRMPEQLKTRVESAARREGLSANTWLVRAAAGALQRVDPGRRCEPLTPLGTRRFAGWAR